MRRGLVVLLVLPSVVVAACGASDGAPRSAPVTAGPLGPLENAVITQTQLRQVPGFSTAKVTPLDTLSLFDEPDPRAPCGAKDSRLDLRHATGVAVSGESIRGGAQLVVRLPPGEAKRYLDAAMANTSKGCVPYETKTAQGATQRVQLVRIVRLHREVDQAIAVVSALTVGKSVRAETRIEMRQGDVLARTLVYSNLPLPNVAVRGLASVIGQNLLESED